MLNTTNNQTNLSLTSLDMQQRLQDRRVFEQFLNKTNRVTCDKPKGHLVKENPAQMFGSMFVDIAKDTKNLGNALLTGKSNDHELGRMNDLGMKLGGGLIAAALIGSKTTTSKKLMEIFGFGTFFSVMSLWPKVAIDLPTKLMHGFNPHQKYIDSQGRKKQFFQDNQYLPWDVWSKEEINKVADKMNVPKDLKDREEFTKEKMRTIALQGNTLWMLTAGFATPLLTSLACNRIEEGIRVPVANHNLRKLSSDAGNLEGAVGKVLSDTELFKTQDEKVASLVQSLRQGTMPENMAETLGEAFDIGRYANDGAIRMEANGLRDAQDLISRLFVPSGSYDDFAKALAGAEGDDAVKSAKELFEAAFKSAKSANADDSFESVLAFAQGIVQSNPEKYAGEWVDRIFDDIDEMPETLKTLAKTKAGYSQETLSKGADAIERVYRESVRPAQATMKTFGDKLKVLDGISGEKYNKTAAKMVKALGFSDKELTVLRNSSTATGETLTKLITEKIAEIAANDKKYEEVTRSLKKVSDSIETVTTKEGSKASIKGVFETLADKVGEGLKALGIKVADEADDVLSGSTLKQTLEQGLTEQERLAAKSNITSVDAMITKLRSAIELERKIGDGTLIKDWAKFAEEHKYKGNIQAMTKEEIENFYNMCRRVAWQSTYGDAVNKFYANGNSSFFKTLSDTIFNGTMADGEIKDWQLRMKDMIDAESCIPFPSLEESKAKSMFYQLRSQKYGDSLDVVSHLTKEQIRELEVEAAKAVGVSDEVFKSHGIRFADYGESVLNTFKKQINQMHNDRSWMKVFGGATIALLGVTFISQLFFGKVKDEHLYQRKENNDTFEGRNKNVNK